MTKRALNAPEGDATPEKEKPFKMVDGKKFFRPDFIEEGDGYADVTLRGEMIIDGAKVKVVRVREPLVADDLVSQKTKGDGADRELTLFANLIGVTPKDLHGLRSRDYGRLQIAYSYCFTD